MIMPGNLDLHTPETLPAAKMMEMIRELQVQNDELQRSRAELVETLRSKEALLEKANTMLMETWQELPRQVTRDPMTGLLKHRAALKLLSKELARCKRHGEELAIGLCDIDDFGALNKNWGYQVGNEVLCWFAQTITASLREYDTVARIGSDTFLLIMPLKPGIDAKSVCERLCSHIAHSEIDTTSGKLHITVSMGVAYAAASSLMKELLLEADAALCHAKKRGSNRAVHFAKA